jgi:LAO/AO transport system kinase
MPADRSPRQIARLITLLERDDPAAPDARQGLEESLGDAPLAPVLGITGAPGVGKSTLIGAVAARLADRRVFVIAVDPSSTISGGALLGDRTRIRAPGDRVFVRSQASRGAVGGLAPRTYPVVRAMRRLFDLVLVETVGVGQSETAVTAAADAVYLVLQPLAGDALQHFKAGIMETPDAIVLTKCDAGGEARLALAELAGAIPLARPGSKVPIFVTSSRTGEGIPELARAVGATTPGQAERARDDAWIRAQVAEIAGRRGLERLAEAGLPLAGSLDDRLAEAVRRSSG